MKTNKSKHKNKLHSSDCLGTRHNPNELYCEKVGMPPLPWRYEDNGFDGNIVDADGDSVCGGEPSEGRIEAPLAEIIVRAVNAYEKDQEIKKELLAALKIALYDLAILNKWDPQYRPRCTNKAERAIAKASSDEGTVEGK
jgi:hypothetical protein